MRKWPLLVCTVLMCLGAVCVAWWRAEYPSRPALKAQGEQMIDAVERYREVHGEYPQSLMAAGVTPPSHGYGPWRYERRGDGFSLAVGDYGRDWFVLSYVSGGHGWYLDE